MSSADHVWCFSKEVKSLRTSYNTKLAMAIIQAEYIFHTPDHNFVSSQSRHNITPLSSISFILAANFVSRALNPLS